MENILFLIHYVAFVVGGLCVWLRAQRLIANLNPRLSRYWPNIHHFSDGKLFFKWSFNFCECCANF